jgi:hypothetical protein
VLRDLSELPGGLEATVDGGDLGEPQGLVDRGVIPDIVPHLTSPPLQAKQRRCNPRNRSALRRYQRPISETAFARNT